MPSGPIIDGKEVLAAGTYVVRAVEDAIALPGGAGNIVIVGDIPVLEKAVVYKFTSRTALENSVAPNDTTLRTLAKLVYEASNSATPKPLPASVSLVSVNSTTQATGAIPTNVPVAQRPLLTSKIWGSRGNSTVVRLSHRAVVGGVKAKISNVGVTQITEAPGIPAAISADYTSTPPSPLPTNAWGFGSGGGGSGQVFFGNIPGPLGIHLYFERTLPAALVNVAGNSWEPSGPVVGQLSVTVPAGSDLTGANHLVITITGNDDNGVPVTENLLNIPDDTINTEWDNDVTVTSTTTWSSVTSVDINTDVPGTFTGSVVISGYNYRTGTRDITVADVIQEIVALGSGFTASAGYGNTAAIHQTHVDVWPLHPVPYSLSAEMWSLVRVLNEQSTFVKVDMTGRTFFPVAPPWEATVTYGVGQYVLYDDVWYESLVAGNVGNQPDVSPLQWQVIEEIVVVLSGGTQSTAITATDWQDALNELLFHRIEGRVLMTDDVSIIQNIFIPHLNQCWAEFQVPATGFVGVPGLASFTALQSYATRLDSERIQRCFEQPTIVMPNGTTAELATWALAVMMASAANGRRMDSLNKWQPRVLKLRRNSGIASPVYNDDVIRLGYSTFYGYAQTAPQLLLECTGWISDNNVLRSQAAAVRSAVDVHLYVKDVMDSAVATAGSVDGLRGSLEGVLDKALDDLRTAGVIVEYGDLSVEEFPQFFKAKFKYMPRGTKSYIVIEAQASLAFLNN